MFGDLGLICGICVFLQILHFGYRLGILFVSTVRVEPKNPKERMVNDCF
jgi:hypothetical protein